MQKRIPKPFSLLMFFVLLSNYLSATPECPIISGKFPLANGVIADASATGWYLDATNVSSTGYFAVKSNRLHAQELGGEGIWYSRVFSTAGYSDFQVAVKVSSEGDMNSSEYVKIYYKINGGAETLLDSRTGNFGTIDFTSGTLTGSNVQLVVKIYNYNNGGSQTSKYYIEEYRVFKEKGPCAVSAINVTAAAANGGVLTCASPSLGLSATASGTGTTTWSWSGPNGYTSTAQNPTITAAGTYTVVATNSSGTGSASVTVTDNKAAPVITATGGALACGSCVTISATSNVSGATYKWTGPNSFSSTSQNPTVCAAGTYTVTVTNPANGCSAQQSVSVTAGSSAVTTFWLEDFSGLSNGATSDAGATAWTTSVTGSGTYSVQNNEFKTSFSGSQGVGIWTSQAIDISSKTNVSFSVDLRSELSSSNDAFETADYIRVYYKLNNGAETLVYEDLAGLGSTTNTNASATINSSSLNGSTLQIIIKTSNSDPTERYYFDNIKVTGTSTGTGTVTVTPSVNGTVTCTATAQLSANTSSSVSSWAWTGPNGFTSSVQNPAVSAGGQYVVTATLTSGCAASATITVPENKTAPDITASGGNLACLSNITLNVNSTVSGATYKWTGPNSFTSTSKNPSVTAAGTYTATVTNPANGCTASQSVSVTAGSSAATTFWLEDFAGLSNGTTSDAGATAWTATASGSGTYSVQNNEFKTSFDDQYEGVWTSQAINIAGKSNVTFSVDLRSEVTSGSFETADYIRIYYKLNNGAETLVFEDLAGLGSTTTGTASTTFTSAALNGSTLQVIIKTSNSGSAERYYFDNIKLTGSDIVTESVTATGGVITCTTASVTMLGSSTAGGVSYSWTGPNNFTSTAQNPVITTTGIYTLTVQNPATGCSGTDTALVTLNTTPPGATASASGALSCSGSSSVTLSGNSSTTGVTYNWTGPNNFTSTAQNPAATVAGAYNVTVTNPANGCTSTASATVTQGSTSTWLEDFTLANGATADAGTTPWTTSVNPSTALFSVLNNEFRVSNSSTNTGAEGVWTSGAINITGKTSAAISATVRSSVINGAVMNTDPVYGDYIRFYYKLNNGTEVLFAEKTAGINNHSTTPTPVSISLSGLSANTLQIVVRAKATGNDEFYYFDDVQTIATGPGNVSASATGGLINCTNTSVTLQGSSATAGVSYTWSGPDGYTSAAQNPVVTKPGTYTLTAALGSCTGTAAATVSLDTTKPAVTATHTGSINCITTSVVINGTVSATGTDYSWTGPNGYTATTLNPEISKGGTYIFKATNPVTGCAASASTIVEENTVRPGEISITNSGIITCLTGSVTIFGSSSSSDMNVDYKWEGPNNYSSNSSSATVKHGGVYTLTATNPANGCTSSKSTTVAENTTSPVVTVSNNGPISCANQVVTMSAITNTPNATFLWLGPDFEDVVPVTTTSAAGTYYITVKDPANGCTKTGFTIVTEDFSDCGGRKVTTPGTAKATEQNLPAAGVSNFTFKAYPNPVIANGVIEFTSPQNALATISIYNALGTCEKVLFKGMATANHKYQVTIPATQMKAGAYYYIINTGGKSYTGKLVLVK